MVPDDADAAQALRKGIAAVYADCGMRPNVIVMSRGRLAALEACRRREEATRVLLETATGLHRYLLRRSLGERRLRILWPKMDRRAQDLRMRRLDWKHRHDPEWL